MAIITLTSDWGTSDYYTAAVKGVILSQIPNATIVDISHEISHYNIAEAGFIMRNCYRNFPDGTIHILAVETIESDQNPHVVVKAKGQYFVGTDNGIFSHILDNEFDEAVYIDVEQDTNLYTFSTRDRFAKVAIMIAKGEPLKSPIAMTTWTPRTPSPCSAPTASSNWPSTTPKWPRYGASMSTLLFRWFSGNETTSKESILPKRPTRLLQGRRQDNAHLYIYGCNLK